MLRVVRVGARAGVDQTSFQGAVHKDRELAGGGGGGGGDGTGSALAFLPDADVTGFLRGVDYGAAWGHRGATHSLTFAIALGLAVGRLTSRPWRTALVASAVLCSDGLLDTITYGGLGCALLWPFDLTRYSAPWHQSRPHRLGWPFSPRVACSSPRWKRCYSLPS